MPTALRRSVLPLPFLLRHRYRQRVRPHGKFDPQLLPSQVEFGRPQEIPFGELGAASAMATKFRRRQLTYLYA